MTDRVSPGKRSRMMAGIRAKDTKPEMVVRRLLHRAGFRYGLHRRDLPGRPDLTLPKLRAVVFVHGCFWHAHQGCKYAATPKSRREFWTEKFQSNRRRDADAVRLLISDGWRVAVVWECLLRRSPESALTSLSAFLRSDQEYAEFPMNQEPRIE